MSTTLQTASSRAGRPVRAGLLAAMPAAFAAAVAVGLLHALDDALLHRQPGVPAGQHLPALLVVTAGGLAAVLLFPRLRAGLQSALAFTTAALMGVNGAMHVLHVATGRVEASDVTGLLATAAAVVLLGMAAAIPYLRRGEGAGGRRRRWAKRVLVTVTAVAAVQFVLLPLCIGVVQTHMYRRQVVPPPSTDYVDVSFESTDGLRLSGWYVPSRNRAAVLVVNTAGGIRNGSLQQAQLLASHGYGVLLYDARGSGRSEGTPNGWGWEWDRDVAGALAFLRERPDVDPDRIGGLGLSTGADVLIEVAAEQGGLAAVVADGATARSYADSRHHVTEAPFVWTMISSGALFSGMSPGRPLVELMAEVSPTPVLLIAAGSLPDERPSNAEYARAGGPSVQLWDLPDVDHTAAVRQVPEEYERRVIGLFDRALRD